MQERPQPGQGDDVRLVAEPLHGLRAPLHVLLRPRLRAPSRPAFRRSLRPFDQGQGQRRRGPAPRACARLLGARDGRDRCGHRPLPAGGRALPADTRLPRGTRRRAQLVQHHHARADDRPRRRRPSRGGEAGERVGHLLDPDAGRGRLAEDRAVDRTSASAAAGAEAARRRRRARVRGNGPDPARHLGPARAARRGRPRSPRGRRLRGLGEPALSEARHPRAFPREPRAGLARGARALRTALPAARLPWQGADEAPTRTSQRAR